MSNKPHNLDALDPTIHEVGRLMILTALYPVERMEFLRLQRDWDFNQADLSSHLRRLKKAGYIAVEKTFKGNYPQTWCSLTKKGREALYAYAELLKSIGKRADRA